MSYQPSTWEFDTDAHGNRTYHDEVLNKVQENLLTLSSLIGDIRVDAELNIPIVQGWANCKTVQDPTVKTIALFASKIIEGLGVVFTAGTPAAIAATIASKIVSGLITHFANPQSKDTYNQLQSAASDLKMSIDKHCFFTQEKIGEWLNDLQAEWDKEIETSGVRLSDLAINELLPKPLSKEYIQCREKMNDISTYNTAKTLIPIRWKIRTHRAFPPDGVSNFLCGWQVEFYKVYSRGTWEKWRNSPEFPKIPSDLSDDIEGPYDYIEKGDNAHAQRFMSWYQAYRDYSWSDGSNFDESRQWNGSRWMGFSGRNEYKIDESDHSNLTQGTSFLDLIDDILNGVYNSYGDWFAKNSLPNEPSYYLWYKTKRKNEPEIINDRRVWTLMGNDACQDWAYDSYDIFHWGRAYRGITLHHYTMVDENGNYAPKEFCKWLFKDNGHGKTINETAVAEIGDVYHNWGLQPE